MKMKIKNIILKSKKSILIISIAFISVFSLAFVFDRDYAFEKVKHLDIFYSLFKELNLYYVDEIVPGDLIKVGIDAMLESLDPYTEYIPESEMDDLRIMTTGQYGGIGALIRRIGDYTVIAMPYEGRPADKAGIITGDMILEIDGNCVKGRRVNEISELLKGFPGTSIDIKVKRPGEDKPMVFEIIREDIQLDAVPYYGVVHEGIGYIALNNFTNTSGRDVENALKELKKEHGIEAIIIDLRSNPGGLLMEAVKIVNLFVDKGQEVVSTRGRVAQWDNVYRATNQPLDTSIKVITLVNRASASASEIVAGALQDLDRGVSIGQQTFGKGLVQTTRELSYRGMLKVTTAKYYIPSGRCIQALDYSQRDEQGTAVRVPDSLLTEFKTLNGRTVYEGGGIIPDITMDVPIPSKITINLIVNNIIFDYATQFRLRNPQIAPPKEFVFTDRDYQDFVKFIQDKEFDYETNTEEKLRELIATAKAEKYYERGENELLLLQEKLSHDINKDLEIFKDEIIEIIANEIIMRYYYERGSVIFSLKNDPEVNKAIEILTNQDQYRSILNGTYHYQN